MLTTHGDIDIICADLGLFRGYRPRPSRKVSRGSVHTRLTQGGQFLNAVGERQYIHHLSEGATCEIADESCDDTVLAVLLHDPQHEIPQVGVELPLFNNDDVGGFVFLIHGTVGGEFHDTVEAFAYGIATDLIGGVVGNNALSIAGVECVSYDKYGARYNLITADDFKEFRAFPRKHRSEYDFKGGVMWGWRVIH